MTPDEFRDRTAHYRSEMADVIDRWVTELGPTVEAEVHPDDFIDWTFEELSKRADADVVGWALVIELFDPMDIESPGYLRFMQPAMQTPAHTRGLLVQGEAYLSP